MSDVVKLIIETGSYGLVLLLAAWIIYDYIKNKSKDKKTTDGSSDLKKEIKEMLNDKMEIINTSINAIGTRVSNLETAFIELKSQPCNPSITINNKPSHPKQFLDRLKLGPQIHKTLNTFRARINADHIFIGSFHNGNESITGIPYYKFDIIAEKFRRDKVEDDCEFAHMYKDAELLRHDLLPTEVIQMGVVHYIIDENNDSSLAEIDDIIYRRMLGRGIKQLAICLLRDPNDQTPSGFVGCVRYDYENIDLHELRDCGLELEAVYAANEKLITSKISE